MAEEWCRQQLANLHIKDRRLTALTEIRNHLSTLPPNEIIVTSNLLSINDLFDCVVEDKNET